MSGKKAAVLLLALAAVLLVLRFVVFAGGKDDATLIREALADSIKASKDGRPGGVLDKLSDRFQVNKDQPERSQIADVVRRMKPDVVVLKPDPVVTGESARITSPVKLSFNFMGQQKDVEVSNVTITFEREDSRKWLIIPDKQWRVTQVDVPDSSISQLGSLGLFGM